MGEAHDRDGQSSAAGPAQAHGHLAVGAAPQKRRNVVIFGLTPLSVLVGCKLKRSHYSIRIVRNVFRPEEGDSQPQAPAEDAADTQLVRFAESSGIAVDEFPFLSLTPAMLAPPPPLALAQTLNGGGAEAEGGTSSGPNPPGDDDHTGSPTQVTVDPKVEDAPDKQAPSGLEPQLSPDVPAHVAALQQLLWVTPPWAVVLMLADDEMNAVWGKAVCTSLGSAGFSSTATSLAIPGAHPPAASPPAPILVAMLLGSENTDKLQQAGIMVVPSALGV